MKKIILALLIIFIWQAGFSIHPIRPKGKKKRQDRPSTEISLREECDQPKDIFLQEINNVRAILTTGGDTWTKNGKGAYIVPKKEDAAEQVSSLYAGAVWIGGRDAAGNIKFMASGHRSSDKYDIYAGPLDENGEITKEECERWDRHFRVLGKEIDQHIRAYEEAQREGVPMNCDSIPDGIKYWPAIGNPYFYEKYKFNLPPDHQLADFTDVNHDFVYNPCDGDYPAIHMEAPEGRGECPEGVYADEIFFWVYNDAGGSHKKTHGEKIHMEVQVEAFGWATNDEVNDMTFQKYKLINKANSDIRDCYFAWWVDPDLGCHQDDYIGCVPPPVDLMYVYNADELDGSDGCACGNVNTYCDKIPLIGVDYFRGPQAHFNIRLDSVFRQDTIVSGGDTTIVDVFEKMDTVLVPIAVSEDGDTTLELGMTSFAYYYNPGSLSSPKPAQTDPETVVEYYRYIRGYWKDGTPITRGGDGYNAGSKDTIKYVFPDAPNNNDPDAWSMAKLAIPPGDLRTIQATGPFVLKPGDVNELIIGVPWVPNQSYPKPSLDALLAADELAQALFDNCFKIQDGPDAPDVNIVELDRELILILSNDTLFSNNKNEDYSEVGIKIDRDKTDDIYYRFEGYQVYQLYNGDVSVQELDDFDKARIVFQCDIKNGVGTLYNWHSIENPSPNGASEKIYIPEKKVTGADNGLYHVIHITEDQFAQEDKSLVNHKPYYYLAIAYEYNNWKEFSPNNGTGQREPYFAGRRNVKIYKAVPRPIEYAKLNTKPGDGPEITRVEGLGISNIFVDITDEAREQILENNVVDNLTYKAGSGPIKIEVYDPFEIQDRDYQLELWDNDMSDDVLDTSAYWILKDLTTGETFKSKRKIKNIYEQVIEGNGFAVTIYQSPDVMTRADKRNGVIGGDIQYKDVDATQWLVIIPDDSGIQTGMILGDRFEVWDVTNFLKTGKGEPDERYDPDRAFNKYMRGAPFAPFLMTAYETSRKFYISPAARNFFGKIKRSNCKNYKCLPEKLNNVDIIFTPDKSKWSRCIVVEESYSDLYSDLLDNIPGIVGPEGGAKNFQLRQAPSVGKDDNDGDGLPDPDNTGTGMAWFPGYAIDVETGERLNIFFGEASIYGGSEAIDTLFEGKKAPGRDMMFNPTSDIRIGFPGGFELEPGNDHPWLWPFGGMHMVYVTNTRYDECAKLADLLSDLSDVKAIKKELTNITWSGVITGSRDSTAAFLSYADGLIPSEVTVKLRVNNPYQVADPERFPFLRKERNGYGTYTFSFKDKAPGIYAELEKENPLDRVNVVPNPYYAYSEYEKSQFNKQVKITNLPGKCTVTIYSIDGKFIKKYERDERGKDYRLEGNSYRPGERQIYPDLVWDLKNHKGIPVASGVYLIHIKSDELKAERTIKWFGINRQFDPTGL